DRVGQLLRASHVSGILQNLYADTIDHVDMLREELNRHREWVGTCKVVREYVWGDDIRDYFGSAIADNEVHARDMAREDAYYRCEVELGNLQKCTVVESACYAVQQ